MAFTEAQKVGIYRFTGWSDRFHATDDTLNRAIVAIEMNRPETEAVIVDLLTKCTDQVAAIVTAQRRLKALAVGPIQLTGAGEIETLRDVGRQWSAQIAQLLGVAMRRDPWSGTAPTESAWYYGPQGSPGEMDFG